MRIDDSWEPWINPDGTPHPPSRGLLIQIARTGWQVPVTCYREDMPPEMNGWGLFWRLTGIAKYAT